MIAKHWMLRTLAGIGLIAILAGCNGAGVPAPTIDVQPTLNFVQTQSAQTVVAGLTQAAPPPATATKAATATPFVITATLPAPTVTPNVITATPGAPTATPTKPTSTYVPWTRTPTESAWSCTISEVTPKMNTVLSPGADFDGKWVLKNSGTEKWYGSDIDIRYASGVKFQSNKDNDQLRFARRCCQR